MAAKDQADAEYHTDSPEGHKYENHDNKNEPDQEFQDKQPENEDGADARQQQPKVSDKVTVATFSKNAAGYGNSTGLQHSGAKCKDLGNGTRGEIVQPAPVKGRSLWNSGTEEHRASDVWYCTQEEINKHREAKMEEEVQRRLHSEKERERTESLWGQQQTKGNRGNLPTPETSLLYFVKHQQASVLGYVSKMCESCFAPCYDWLHEGWRTRHLLDLAAGSAFVLGRRPSAQLWREFSFIVERITT
ncbi:unnamed protein product, partial [Symbiodinium necroappetens]